MSGNKARAQQAQQQMMLFSQLALMQRQQDQAVGNAKDAQAAERARIEAQVAAEEEQKKQEAKKKAEAPFVRSSVLTTPFGLLSQPSTASRNFLS